MDVTDLFAWAVLAGLAALGGTEWWKLRRADELHRLQMREVELTCRMLERDLAATPTAPG